MLFVGFSLGDDNFHRIVDAVRRLRRGFEHDTPPKLGTTLTLGGSGLTEVLWEEDLFRVRMEEREESDAGFPFGAAARRPTARARARGSMCALPLPTFPTGVMRPRFHPAGGSLYVCGMYAWAGNQTAPGGFYRVRYTRKPADVPVGLAAKVSRLEVTFTDPVDPKTADAKSFELKV